MTKVLFGEILEPEDEATRSERVKRRFFETFRKAARYIPFAEDLVAAYYCAMDTDTPDRVRATLLASLAYFVLPTDVIPDFIVGVGYGDDAAILLATIALVRSHITPDHFVAARRFLDGDATTANASAS